MWPGSNQNTGAVKAPPWTLNESQGAVSGRNAAGGIKVQGCVLLLMTSTRRASASEGLTMTRQATASSDSHTNRTWTAEAFHAATHSVLIITEPL